MSELTSKFFEEHDLNPTVRSAFSFFYGQTQKEGLPVEPEYAWDQFENGVAKFNGDSIEEVDKLASGLIPNYKSTDGSELPEYYPATPMDIALSESFMRNLEYARTAHSARVIGIHPTLASPLLYARAIGMGYERYLETDIREKIYITYGAYPTTMRYSFGEREEDKISPTKIGRTLGNVILTAPKSANTDTDDEMVESWMKSTRETFRQRNHDILSEPGNIEIVIPSGRRGKRCEAKVPPYTHIEYLPDGRIDYITGYDNPTFVMGVSDSLLLNLEDIGSEVIINGKPHPFTIKRPKDLRDALVESARLVSSQNTIYSVEGTNDQKLRLSKKAGKKAIGRLIRRPVAELDSEGY